MTSVSRYGQGGRQAYGLVSNLSTKSPGSASTNPAQGQLHRSELFNEFKFLLITSLADIFLSLGNQTQNPASNVQQKNPKLYKTELCRSWMDHGRCNYGER